MGEGWGEGDEAGISTTYIPLPLPPPASPTSGGGKRKKVIVALPPGKGKWSFLRDHQYYFFDTIE